MKSQACEPCAKRKVRCDRQEPCSNCKRRKHDHCSYPGASPFDKIKRLETLVRKLGGDPESAADDAGTLGIVTPQVKSTARSQHQDQESIDVIQSKSKDPLILEEDGQSVYLESRVWQGWLGHAQQDSASRDTATKNHFLTPTHPDAFQGLLYTKSSVDLVKTHPSQEDAVTLWTAFNERTYPLVRITMKSDLESLRTASVSTESRSQLTDAEHGFIFSLYLSSVISLSEEECRQKLSQERSILMYECQMVCEEALSRTNLFRISDITVFKALAMYMLSGIDRLSTQSLWSLMGMVLRSAEKLGLHRDGSLLNLSPVKTEERRRIWWQLQHIDLILAVRSGLTSLTLMADWDVKLPLNIEDDDIKADMTEPPKERSGLTSMSYCLFTYWVIYQQRAFFQSRKSQFELSWQSNASIPDRSKESLTDLLEDGLNKRFLQYCDPIKPVHTLIQLFARSLICGIRLRTLHPLVHNTSSEKDNKTGRDELLTISMQCLEYNIAMNSQHSLRNFRWLTKGLFPWHAFMCVLVGVSQENEPSKSQPIWDLLSDLYSVNSMLYDIFEDRRRSHAAGLVVAAWKTCQNNLESMQSVRVPDFVGNLEIQLQGCRTRFGRTFDPNEVQQVDTDHEATNSEGFLVDQYADEIFDLDFEDIDWSFWNSID